MNNIVRATLVHIEKERQGRMGSHEHIGTISGDDNLYYYLPGAGYAETLEALRKAGFQLADRIMDAVNDAAEQQRS